MVARWRVDRLQRRAVEKPEALDEGFRARNAAIEARQAPKFFLVDEDA